MTSRRARRGQTVSEFGTIAALVAVITVGVLILFGGTIVDFYNDTDDTLAGVQSGIPSAGPTATPGVFSAGVVANVANVGSFVVGSPGTHTGTVTWTLTFAGGTPTYGYVADFTTGALDATYPSNDQSGQTPGAPLNPGDSPVTLSYPLTCTDGASTTASIDITVNDSAAHSAQFNVGKDIVFTCPD